MKRSRTPKIERDNQQEVIDTVLTQGDQISIKEENTCNNDLAETLASNQPIDELSKKTSKDLYEDMADADIQEL